MKTSLKISALLCTLALATVFNGCTADPGNTDGGPLVDGGRDAGRDAGRDGGQRDGSMGDEDGGVPVDAGCFANPRTPEEIAQGCTNSFKLPVARVPPCAGTGALPAPGSDLPTSCLPTDAGDPSLPDGSTCFFPD